MTSTDRRAVERVPPDRFGEFVATLWRRQGWAVSRIEAGDGLYAVVRETAGVAQRRALHSVYRSPGGTVGSAGVRDRARVDLAPDGTTLATNAGFSPGAVETAGAHGVDLVGPDDLARLVDALDARPLLTDSRIEGSDEPSGPGRAPESDPG